MDMYKKNIELLSKKDLSLTDRIKGLSCDGDIDLERSRSGHPVLKVKDGDGKTILLHSVYDPVKEAERYIGNFMPIKSKSILVFGLGLGYHILEVLKRTEGDISLTVVEKDLCILKKAMECMDLSEIFSSNRVVLIVGENEFKVIRILIESRVVEDGFLILEHPPSAKIHCLYYKVLRRSLTFRADLNLGQNRRSSSFKEKNIFVVSKWPDLWDMGEGCGRPDRESTLSAFLEAGYNVHLVLPQPPGHKLKDGKIGEINTYRIPNPFGLAISKRRFITHFLCWAIFIITAWLKIMKISRRFRPDLIYGMSDYSGPVASIIGRIYRIPSIVRFYGVFIQYDLSTLKGLLYEFVQVAGFKAPVTKIIATDDGTGADKVAKQLGVRRERLLCWKNGVDRDLCKEEFDQDDFRKRLGISLDKRIVVATSRLIAWKRFDRLIRVIPAIAATNENVLFMIVGDGPMRRQLENACKALSIDQYVKFIGAISHKDIYKYLRISDIFVSLADFSNAGSSLLEAIANGCTIITLRAGEIERFIQDKYNGLLLEADDHTALTRAILMLLDNEKLRKRFGENARRFAEENLPTWKERLALEVKLVTELMSSC